MRNPFDISFGKKPIESISRFRQSSEIIDAFSSPDITQQIYMITGVRGAGKTVFMNTIANTLENAKDWIVIRLNPERDMLQSFGAKLCSHQESAQMFQASGINLSALGFGTGVTFVPAHDRAV